MSERDKNEQYSEQTQFLAGLSGAQSETVQRYGAAVKEHVVAYSGINYETDQIHSKSLKSISQSKINPADQKRNLKQQAGFSAEVKTSARENAEKIINGDYSSMTTRTDDMVKQPDGHGHTIGGKNEQLYDIAEINQGGTYKPASGRQLKYVGGDSKSCYSKILGKKYDKYRDAGIPIEIPSDFYQDVKEDLQNRATQLKKQINSAEQHGDSALAQKHGEQLKRVEKTQESLRQGKLTNAEAIEARMHPLWSTTKDVAQVSHRAGVEAGKYGAILGGLTSIATNLVATVNGDKDLIQALQDVAENTACSATISYATGFTGSAVSGIMQNSGSQFIRSLSHTNLPGTLVTVSVSAAATTKRYCDGEISGVECFEELGEQGIGMLSSALFATIGQVAIPIPVVGGLIGGMLGYALASASYGTLLDALKQADRASQERIQIEKACEEQIQLIREYRSQVDSLISEYLLSYTTVFQKSFTGIIDALEIGDADALIFSANQISESLGKHPLFKNKAEFDALMNSKEPIKF